MYTTQNELSKHTGLQWMTCRCGYMGNNNCASVAEDVGTVGGYVCGRGVRWEISVLPTLFSCEPKAVLVNKWFDSRKIIDCGLLFP